MLAKIIYTKYAILTKLDIEEIKKKLEYKLKSKYYCTYFLFLANLSFQIKYYININQLIFHFSSSSQAFSSL